MVDAGVGSDNEDTKLELTPQNDEVAALAFELVRNGSPIDWQYWSNAHISHAQAAQLAHSIDPRKWDRANYAEGPLPDDLRQRIARLELWLGTNWEFPWLDLAHLVRLLGDDFATWTLKQAAAPQIVAIEAEKEKIETQTAERRRLGRYILEEAAAELASSSGISFERWLETLVSAAKAGALPLCNPKDHRDNLPYYISTP